MPYLLVPLYQPFLSLHYIILLHLPYDQEGFLVHIHPFVLPLTKKDTPLDLLEDCGESVYSPTMFTGTQHLCPNATWSASYSLLYKIHVGCILFCLRVALLTAAPVASKHLSPVIMSF